MKRKLDYKDSLTLKNWCFWTVLLAESFESALDWKEIQPIYPKGISPEYSLEGLMLKLKLQYFGHLMRRTDFLKKTLMLGMIEGMGRRGRKRMRWSDGITDLMDLVWGSSRSWWWTGKPGVLQSMGSQRVGHDWVTELNWKEFNHIVMCFPKGGTRTPPPRLHYSFFTAPPLSLHPLPSLIRKCLLLISGTLGRQ